MSTLRNVLQIDIRKGITKNLSEWVQRIPLDIVWNILLLTYAQDVGTAWMAKYIWKKYKENTVNAAYEVAYILATSPKSRLVRWVTKIFWKVPGDGSGSFRKSLGEIVGNLQSAYRYDWDPYLQYKVFKDCSNTTEDVWEYLLEVTPILGHHIFQNIAALRSMCKVTNCAEFLVLAIISITQPGEWQEFVIPNIPPPNKKTDKEIPDYCYDITTGEGWSILRELAEDMELELPDAISFGIENYYKTSLRTKNERKHILSPIYKKYALDIDLDKFNCYELDYHIHTVSVLRRLPRKNGIFDTLLGYPKK